MKVEILNRKPTPIVYLRHTGPYGESLGMFWQRTVYPWMVVNGLLPQERYGISHDDPNVVAAASCRYDAGCEAPHAPLAAPGDSHSTTIPGGKYAALSFSGTIGEIEAAWTAMLRDWLPSSGLQLDGRPMFEYYPQDSKYDAASGVFDCKLCVPVIAVT